MTQRLWVYNTQVFANCVVIVFFEYNNQKFSEYAFNRHYNNFDRLLEFLLIAKEEKSLFIGFDNLALHSQIIEDILANKDTLSAMTTSELCDAIYGYHVKATDLISKGKFSRYAEWDLSIQNLDIRKVNHFDKKKKPISLEWIRYMLDDEDISVIGINNDEKVEDNKLFESIKTLCKKEVQCIYNLTLLSTGKIGLRYKHKKKYKISCLNSSDTKLGSDLLLHLYCRFTKKDSREVNQLRTRRTKIAVKDIIFPYIKFYSSPLKDLLEKMKNKVIDMNKPSLKYQVEFKDTTLSYGLGGLHQKVKKGIVSSDSSYNLIYMDITSQWPNIAIHNNLHPQHLGLTFTQVYKEKVVDVRMKEIEKKKGDQYIIDGFKQAANCAIGRSRKSYSWMFDSQYFMQITINSQLLVTMLIEKLFSSIKKMELIQTNTDGLIVKIHKKEMTDFKIVCGEWSELTGLKFKFFDIDKLYIAGMNDYIMKYSNSEVNSIGRFEWVPFDNYSLSTLNKNKSYLIIPKAINNYFNHGIKPEETIKRNTNIFDYCAGVSAKDGWYFEENSSGVKGVHRSKVLRYFVSNSGSRVFRAFAEKRLALENESYKVTILNKVDSKHTKDYDINTQYYLNRIYKEIDAIQPTADVQLDLFS